jgi:glycosyltransferase involved in cell wall biosynthesis
MKIALIDNMNNNFFALARYLRDLGVEADLYLIPRRGNKHFEPQEDTWIDLKNESWIKEFPVSYNFMSYFVPLKSKLNRFLFEYDKIIACGSSLGLLTKAGVKVDMFIPYGSDLIHSPFNSYEVPTMIRHLLRIPIRLYISQLQRIGIQRSKIIVVNTNWKLANDALKKLNLTAINLPRVMIYKEEYPLQMEVKYSWLSEYDFSIFSPTRHEWATNSEPMPDFNENKGAKRNDKLIKAFALFVESRHAVKPILILSEYGADVSHSKELIRHLRIEKFVKWLPILPRKELSIVMKKVNIVADQFREGMSATSAGTTNEALAAGKPVIANTDGACKDIFDPYFSCPILEALTVEEIYAWLNKLSNSSSFTNSIGDDSLQWFDKNLGYGLAEKYVRLLSSNH